MQKIWIGRFILCLGLTMIPFHAEAVQLTANIAGHVMAGTDSLPIVGTHNNIIIIENVAPGQAKIIAGLAGLAGGDDGTMDRLSLVSARIRPTNTYPWGTEQIITYEGIFTNPPVSNAATPIWYKLSGPAGSAGSISRANAAASIQADGWIGIPLVGGVPSAWYNVTNAILSKNCSAGALPCTFFSNPATLSQKCPNPDPAPCPDITAVQRKLKVEIRVKFANANQSITVSSLPLFDSPAPGLGDDGDDVFAAPPSEFIKKRCEDRYCRP